MSKKKRSYYLKRARQVPTDLLNRVLFMTDAEVLALHDLTHYTLENRAEMQAMARRVIPDYAPQNPIETPRS